MYKCFFFTESPFSTHFFFYKKNDVTLATERMELCFQICATCCFWFCQSCFFVLGSANKYHEYFMQVEREIWTIFAEKGETCICVFSFLMFICEYIFTPNYLQLPSMSPVHVSVH